MDSHKPIFHLPQNSTKPENQNLLRPAPPPPPSLVSNVQHMPIRGPHIGNQGFTTNHGYSIRSPHFTFQPFGQGSLSTQQRLYPQQRNQFPLLPRQLPLPYHTPPPPIRSSSLFSRPPPPQAPQIRPPYYSSKDFQFNPPQDTQAPPPYYSSKDFQFNPPGCSQPWQPLPSPTQIPTQPLLTSTAPTPPQPLLPPQLPLTIETSSHSSSGPSVEQQYRPPIDDTLRGHRMLGVEAEELERLRIERKEDKEKQDKKFKQQLRESQNKLLQIAQTRSSSGSRGPSSSRLSHMDERSTPLLRGHIPENRLKKPSSSICNMTPPKDVQMPQDPEDKALLRFDEKEEGEVGSSDDGGGGGGDGDGDGDPITPIEIAGMRKKERPGDEHLPWLVKTQYISPLSMDSTKKSMEKQARMHQQNVQAKFNKGRSDRILSSFSASMCEPVHTVNPELKPQKIRPFLPKLDRHDDEFMVAHFDGPPTDSEFYGHLKEEDRAMLGSKAIMKNYVASSPRLDSDKPDIYLAYMVPSVGELDKAIYEDNKEVSYTQIREYEYELCSEDVKEPTTYLVTFGESEVQYLPVPTRLALKKKRKSKKSEGSTDSPLPEKMIVKNKGGRGRRLKKKNTQNPNDDDHPKELEDDLSS